MSGNLCQDLFIILSVSWVLPLSKEMKGEFNYRRDPAELTAISRVGVDVIVRGRAVLPIIHCD